MVPAASGGACTPTLGLAMLLPACPGGGSNELEAQQSIPVAAAAWHGRWCWLAGRGCIRIMISLITMTSRPCGPSNASAGASCSARPSAHSSNPTTPQGKKPKGNVNCHGSFEVKLRDCTVWDCRSLHLDKTRICGGRCRTPRARAALAGGGLTFAVAASATDAARAGKKTGSADKGPLPDGL